MAGGGIVGDLWTRGLGCWMVTGLPPEWCAKAALPRVSARFGDGRLPDARDVR